MTPRALLVFLALLGAGAAPAQAARLKTIQAEVGRPFTLRKSQRALLKGTNASIRLAGFINSPCPKGARCVWSGQRALLELTVAGKSVPLDDKAPFAVDVKSSDYATRAVLLATARTMENP